MSSASSSISVVIRAAGERTLDACRCIVVTQVPAECVSVVAAGNFPQTLEASLNEGIKFGRHWTLLLDADVLLRSDAFALVLEELESEPGQFYMLNFPVLDRGFGGPAYAGIHAYPTVHLKTALQFMGKARFDQRPETRLCKEMGRLALPTLRSRTILGLHDFEQYYADLYRKYFVRAFKYRTQIDYINRRLRLCYQQSDEAQAMMWGLLDGTVASLGSKIAQLDNSFYRQACVRTFEMLGLRERPPLDVTYLPIHPDQLIQNYRPDELYLENEQWLLPKERVCWAQAQLDPNGRLPSRIGAALRSAIGRLRRGSLSD